MARLMVFAVAVALVGSAQAQGPASLQFRVLAGTGIKLTDVAWTGSGFLYLENTSNTVWSAPPAGKPLRVFARMPRKVEETRCRVSPGTHGWVAGLVFCHAPDNTIYRLSADGRGVTRFAKVPERSTADGALAFDTAGAFGYGLVAATGRSGSPKKGGGNVYAIDQSGVVRRIGHYGGPGGADEVAVAPRGFGTAARAALLTVDAGRTGRLVAVGADGRSRSIARFPDGPNPIAAIIPAAIHGGDRAGLYVTDTLSENVYTAAAVQLRPYLGDVIVGSELQGLFWVVRPRGYTYQVLRLPSTLSGKHYNLEGMAYVSP